MTEGEIIVYDPKNPDTYPSVCHTPEEVLRRFGWVGGERFTNEEIAARLESLND